MGESGSGSLAVNDGVTEMQFRRAQQEAGVYSKLRESDLLWPLTSMHLFLQIGQEEIIMGSL